MPARFAALAAFPLVFGACATRGDVRQLHQDVAAVSSALGVLQAQQIAGSTEEALRNELKTLGAQVLALETRIADAAVQIGRLDARLASTERARREQGVVLETLTSSVAKLNAPPPAPAPTLPSSPRTPRAAPAAEQAYASALTTFRAREHGQAVLDFLDFIARYPKHPLGANAQFWIGEAYYLQRDYRQAIVEFEKVLEHGAGNPKAPDALLKAGMAYRSLRDGTRAAEVWRRIVREFPKSEAAARARELLRATGPATTRR